MDTPPSTILEFTEDTLCEGGVHASNAYVSLRIIGIVVILAASCVGVVLPRAAANHHSIAFLVKAFSGGVIIGTAFIHVLADSDEALTNPCIGWGDYPWPFAIAAMSVLFMFTAEFYMDKALECLGSSYIEPAEPSSSADGAVSVVVASKDARPPTGEEEHVLTRRQLTIRSYSLEMGIVLHSIFIGIALGVSHDKNTITSLMVALAFHQLNEGLALGSAFMQAEYSALKYAVFAALFALVTPVGVVIGMLVGDDNYGANKNAIVTEGVFNAASAGILLHNGLVDVIVPAFCSETSAKEPLRACGFLSLFLGCVSMAVIGKWA